MNIFSLSFGKDSMATLILAAEQGIPIDRVMYCDIRFSPELSGEHPLMAAWIPTAERRLKELFGIEVEHAYCRFTFCDGFYRKHVKGKLEGEICGYPLINGSWCNDLKRIAIRKYYKGIAPSTQIVEFVGIAYDEPKRWDRMLNKQTKNRKCRSILVEQCITEQECFCICRKYDLLSPMYDVDGIYRGGCWFCPKQCMADLWSLWKNYPDLYNRLLEMEPYSHNTFKPRGVTLALLAERFENGYIPKRKVKSKFVQLDMFDKV